jgi:hypothetical protein
MSEAAKQETAKAGAYQAPLYIPTAFADVAVYGWECVSKTMLNVVSMFLNLPLWLKAGDHGVRVLTLGELGLKKPHQAEMWPHGQHIGVDLENIFQSAVKRTQTTQPSASIYTWYILNVLISVLHEAFHLSSWAAGENIGNEDEAEEWAIEQLIDIAKTFNVEPDEWTNEPFFKDSVLGVGLGELGSEDWAEHQKHMLDNRLFFFKPEADGELAVKYHTFKSYIHGLMTNDKPDDESWMGEPIVVPPIAKAVAEINPADGPQVAVVGGATGAMNIMADQAANMGVITPVASEAIPMPAPEAAPSVVVPESPREFMHHQASGNRDFENVVAQECYEDMEDISGMDDTDKVYDYVEREITGQPQRFIPTPITPPATGAPGTPFIMNGQPVGTNVQPDAPIVSAPEVNVYNPTSMDDNTLVAVIQGIYAKIYDHIFGYCGAYAGGFTHPSKVHELQIQLDEREAEAIVKMDCLDANGRWMANFPTKYEHQGQVKARILGATTKTTKMPYYKLYINANGRELCRFIIPQNPQKRSANGQFSKPALAAQSGSRILYIMEGNDQIVQAGGKKVLCKIVDGSMQV